VTRVIDAHALKGTVWTREVDDRAGGRAKPICLTLNTTPLLDEQGELVGEITIARDVIAMRQKERSALTGRSKMCAIWQVFGALPHLTTAYRVYVGYRWPTAQTAMPS
jgi:hypothetical protein